MIPRIGRYWEGGIYAGITPGEQGDFHLIAMEPAINLDGHVPRDVIYAEAEAFVFRLTHASNAEFRDWRLPTRQEAALLYANIRGYFNEGWHWTSDPYPPDHTCHWVQSFAYGRQCDARMTDACRVRLVRTVPCV